MNNVPYPMGMLVGTSKHPAISGRIIDLREIVMCGKPQRIYKLSDDGIHGEWVNEMYLEVTPRQRVVKIPPKRS